MESRAAIQSKYARCLPCACAAAGAPRINALTPVSSADSRSRYLQPHEVLAFVVVQNGEKSVVTLLLLRSKGDGGFWHCIAGGVEAGETVIEAARREVD